MDRQCKKASIAYAGYEETFDFWTRAQAAADIACDAADAWLGDSPYILIKASAAEDLGRASNGKRRFRVDLECGDLGTVDAAEIILLD